MKNKFTTLRPDYVFLGTIGFLIIFGVVILSSIASFLFPLYFVFIFLSLIFFYFLSQIDFEVITLFKNHLYIFSIFLLILTLIIGQVSRGAIRWIPLGPLTIQPAEIARPFLILFLASFLTETPITLRRLVYSLVLMALPLFLIIIQPSLGVGILTGIGFLGVFLAADINKKYILLTLLTGVLLLPLVWQVLAPYQQSRIFSFVDPSQDRYGAGYNSIQSMISVGSGKIFGRGLGRGVQTQLAFLPERHTDFVFASISEELGFIGSLFLIAGFILIFWRLINFLENCRGPTARAYISGVFMTIFAQVFINIGMNLGLLPITGIPLPLVSAGGSSLLGTMIVLAIAQGAIK